MRGVFYRIMDRLGLTPWEAMATLPMAEQIAGLFDQAEGGRSLPYESALDVGCGNGIRSVRLAQRGWQVTGIDIVPRGMSRSEIEATYPGGTVAEELPQDLRGAPAVVRRARPRWYRLRRG